MIFNFTNARASVGVALAAAFLLGPAIAHANPRPLPFTYPYETLAEGAAEVELYTDMTPLRVYESDPSSTGFDPNKRLWEPYYRLQAEFEYGITDRWELGLYQVFEAQPQTGGGNAFSYDGMKARIRTRLAEAGEWPVDVGLYLEVAHFHDEIEIEEKVLLSRRFGKLRLMGNLWVEQEFERPFDPSQRKDMAFIINPTFGGTYQVATRVQVGAEWWARGRIGGEAEEGASPADVRNDKIHQFLGPTLHYNMGRAWLTLGLYAHLNDSNKPQPGEAYGPLWFRSVLGIDL